MKQFVLVIMLTSFFACSNKSAGETFLEIKVAFEMNDMKAALNGYKYLYENFPNIEKRPIVLFQLGFIYHNHYKNLEMAKKYYNEFLEKYPEHEMAISVQSELDNLGVPVEELKFLQKAEEMKDSTMAKKKESN